MFKDSKPKINRKLSILMSGSPEWLKALENQIKCGILAVHKYFRLTYDVCQLTKTVELILGEICQSKLSTISYFLTETCKTLFLTLC